MPLAPRLRSALVGALALAAGACSRGDARAADKPSAEAPEFSEAAARPTPPPPVATPAPHLDSGSVAYATRHHRLTMAEMTRWSGVLKSLQARAAKDTSFKLKLGYPPESSVASQARAVEETPALRDALKSAGISGREWVVVTMAYIGASMAAQAPDGARPLAPDVNPENVAFVRQRGAEINALRKR